MQIIIEAELIKTHATNVKILKRKSRKRRRRAKLTRRVFANIWNFEDFIFEVINHWIRTEDVRHFVWWNDRFLKAISEDSANRFRRDELLQTFRFWAFRDLINRRLSSRLFWEEFSRRNVLLTLKQILFSEFLIEHFE